MHLRNCLFQAASGGIVRLTVEAIVILVKRACMSAITFLPASPRFCQTAVFSASALDKNSFTRWLTTSDDRALLQHRSVGAMDMSTEDKHSTKSDFPRAWCGKECPEACKEEQQQIWLSRMRQNWLLDDKSRVSILQPQPIQPRRCLHGRQRASQDCNSYTNS